MTNNVSLKMQEKLFIVSELGTLLKSGIPLLEAVDSLLEESRGNVKKALSILRQDLGQGMPISHSMGKMPNSFDAITTNLIKAAEDSGNLEVTLKDISEHIKRDIEFSDKVRSALIYPMFVLVVFCGVLTTILIFVIPRVADVFERLRMELPLPTQILIWLSDFLIHNTSAFLSIIMITSVVVIALYKKKKKALLNFLFHLPFVSTLAKNIDLAIFTKSLALSMNSGIPILEALDLAKGTVFKKQLQEAIDETAKRVSEGQSLANGFKNNKKCFPNVMTRMVDSGEKSGTLDGAMLELSSYFDDEVTKSLKTLTTLLEPFMLVVMGILVGGIMLSIIAPIYNMIGQIRSR